jgi:tetratricopeptide (TPR) repeat protein
VAISFSSLGTALRRQGKLAEAEKMYRDCLAIREKKVPEAWYTYYTGTMLGGTLFDQGKYSEAEPFLASGSQGMLDRFDRIPAGSRATVKAAIRCLVQVYEKMGQPNNADRWKKKLADLDGTGSNGQRTN